MLNLEDYIREVPDHPEPGILFKDVTPILACPDAFRVAVDWYACEIGRVGVEVVVALDARGFVFGAPAAYKLGLPLVIVRKSGKLPPPVMVTRYELEYGAPEVVEIRSDADAIAVIEGRCVAVVDDLLATGGTALAAADLAGRVGGSVAALVVLVELAFLDGRSKMVAQVPGCEVVSRIVY